MNLTTCKYCKQSKPASEYRVSVKAKGTRRKECRSCENTKISQYQVFKKAEKNPEKYLGCNNCDRIVSKYRIGNKGMCNYCGSRDLEEY